PSLTACSNLPEPSAGHTDGFLFGLAPSGVYHATNCCQSRGALLPHPFTLTGACALRRYTLCCTFRRLAPPRRYLALCPAEPGLSSPPVIKTTGAATVWRTLRRAGYSFAGLGSSAFLDQSADTPPFISRARLYRSFFLSPVTWATIAAAFFTGNSSSKANSNASTSSAAPSPSSAGVAPATSTTNSPRC